MKKSISFAFLTGFFGLVVFTACTNNNTQAQKADMTTKEKAVAAKDMVEGTSKINAKGPKPAWGPDITDELLAVIEKLQSFNSPPLNTLSAQEARKQPSPTDAVMALIKENNVPVPAPKVDTMGKDIAVQGGKIHLRIYSPKAEAGNGPFPIIVYYHGGGWVIANLDTYDPSAKVLAELTGTVLVSVAYRQGPEHKFPTAHNDSYAAYQWAIKNAASIKGNAKQVVVVGESAGGNLAAAVSMMARDKGAMLPIHQVLIYPIAGYDLNTPSYQTYADAKPLNKPLMQWFFDNYLPNKEAGNNKLISLVNADLKGLPPTTIIGAELDPLQSEGKTLADNLKAAGVDVVYKKFDGVTHEFFGMGAISPKANEAEMLASGRIKKSFDKSLSQK